MDQDTSSLVPGPGLHGLFDGVLYPLRFHGGGWAFRSDRPAAGFTADGAVFVRMIAADDHVECFGFRHEGVYRGLPVSVLPRPGGGDLQLVSTDSGATKQGFAPQELRRGGTDWRKLVRNGDPELQVKSTRSPRPVPWADHLEEVLPPRSSTAVAPSSVALGRARGLKPAGLRRSGRYALVDGAEYELVHRKSGWALQSDQPEAGFTPLHANFIRMIAQDEEVQCFKVTHTGVYRDLVVNVMPGTEGLVQLSTRDCRSVDHGFIPFGFERPEIQEYVHTVTVDDPDLRITTTREPIPAPWTQTAPVRPRVVLPPSWEELAAAFAATFRDVSDRAFLIVMASSDPRRYVQFAGAPDLLYAEAPGVDVVADADERVLRAAGWIPPGPGQPNWTSPLDWLADESEFVALAERCVAALRHAYGIRGPSALVYTAWRDPESIPVGETWSAERLETRDRGANPLHLPGLGLPPR
ncbi:hypothetical protein FB561_2795 [Kribbella amoyensis]|uniref:TY-Chap N-terminal domain-containing protein n=1 Tax=Kribbella amoyensis TaxID=996641 RepID=A0A561BS13_9ACTN|nr:hypothetical protein [Kribbella amoyensis]TWD81675.1 hypothetical protein FB561_2795 [Kribbella amoyensis]